MASCASCNSFILFGGKKTDEFRFCNDTCLENGVVLIEASKVPAAEVDALANDINAGVCPMCQERSGVEIRKSYSIASFILYTRHQTHHHVCCRICGLKKQSIDFIGSLFLGWWGVPWGILMTPVQLLKNIFAMLIPPSTAAPSKDLRDAARMMIAQQRLEQPDSQPEMIAQNPIVEM